MNTENNYAWKINALDAYPTQSGQTDVIYGVHWSIIASTGSFSVDVYGVQSVSPYVSGNQFIPYSQLTKDTVVGWVTGSMGEERYNQIISQLDIRLQDLKTPSTVVLPAPWES
jgi:hypothetical protein